MKTLPELLELAKTEEGKDRLNRWLAPLAGWENSGGVWWNNALEHWDRDRPPNYCADLNACHEAITSLAENDRHRCAYAIFTICGGSYGPDGEVEDVDCFYDAINATAAQRTIALILTLQRPSPPWSPGPEEPMVRKPEDRHWNEKMP